MCSAALKAISFSSNWVNIGNWSHTKTGLILDISLIRIFDLFFDISFDVNLMSFQHLVSITCAVWYTALGNRKYVTTVYGMTDQLDLSTTEHCAIIQINTRILLY